MFDADDPAAANERTAWIATLTDYEREFALSYLAGWDPEGFDAARAQVERMRAAEGAHSL